MPVPVPRQSRAPSHLVLKPNIQSGDVGHQIPSVFHNLTYSLPLPPAGPPPSFGTREEWISSLPSWRRNKPRRIWEEEDTHVAPARDIQYFSNGLIDADNAPVIKGERAQACIPPSLSLIHTNDQCHITAVPQQECEDDADDEMSSHSLEYDIESQWSGHSSDSQMETDIEVDAQYDSDAFGGAAVDEQACVYHDQQQPGQYKCGPFTPMFEDMSPEAIAAGDPSSSPVEPMTPFPDFVDRAVAHAFDHTADSVPARNEPLVQHPALLHYEAKLNANQRHSAQLFKVVDHSQHLGSPAAPEPIPTSPSIPYKKMADPFVDWMASYVWKACTTGSGLLHYNAQSLGSPQRYPSAPPAHLANSIRSLFMSTLLQPPAILLAVWYIMRLPISFSSTPFGAEFLKEIRFRAELLGVEEWHTADNRDAVEQYAPFRLVLLGCMLANKWLDDHTFSNKTWHTISNIPIQSLNRLESLALDLFSYDLSIAPLEWSQWLRHVLAGHMSLSTLSHPQPISRPSSNPQSIMRKAVEDLIAIEAASAMPRACNSQSCVPSPPEPVFLGLEDRKREKMDHYGVPATSGIEILDIDLDEDGPLREEYMPKHRRTTSNADNVRHEVGCRPMTSRHSWESTVDTGRTLPPPAKWSPAADEPIFRNGRSRQDGQYVAVQPPMVPPPAPILAPRYTYNPMHGFEYHQSGWDTGVEYMPPLKIQLPPGHHQAYDYSHSAVPSHSRSVSYSNPQHGAMQSVTHSRSQSQSRLEYACSDLRVTAQNMTQLPTAELHWTGADQYVYGAPYGYSFGQVPSFQHPSSWISA